jgi:hypothetical protein
MRFDVLDQSDIDNFTDGDEVYCICNKWQPDQLFDMTGISCVSWGQCDINVDIGLT